MSRRPSGLPPGKSNEKVIADAEKRIASRSLGFHSESRLKEISSLDEEDRRLIAGTRARMEATRSLSETSASKRREDAKGQLPLKIVTPRDFGGDIKKFDEHVAKMREADAASRVAKATATVAEHKENLDKLYTIVPRPSGARDSDAYAFTPMGYEDRERERRTLLENQIQKHMNDPEILAKLPKDPFEGFRGEHPATNVLTGTVTTPGSLVPKKVLSEKQKESLAKAHAAVRAKAEAKRAALRGVLGAGTVQGVGGGVQGDQPRIPAGSPAGGEFTFKR
jgi:hypothetical protein